MDTSTGNPFRIIIADLSEDTWRKVTLEYLEWVNQLLRQHGIALDTYGEVFAILEYLERAGVIEFQHTDDYHLIRKTTYFGKDNL